MELPSKWEQRDEGIVGIRCDRVKLTYCACFLTHTHLFVDCVDRDELQSRGERNGLLDLNSKALDLLLLRLEHLFYSQDVLVSLSSATVTLSLPPWTFDMRLTSDQPLLTGLAWRQLLNQGILLKRIDTMQKSIEEYNRLTRRLKETMRQTQGYDIAGTKEISQHIDYNTDECWAAAVKDESTWAVSDQLWSKKSLGESQGSDLHGAEHSYSVSPMKNHRQSTGRSSSTISPLKNKKGSASPFYTSPVKIKNDTTSPFHTSPVKISKSTIHESTSRPTSTAELKSHRDSDPFHDSPEKTRRELEVTNSSHKSDKNGEPLDSKPFSSTISLEKREIQPEAITAARPLLPFAASEESAALVVHCTTKSKDGARYRRERRKLPQSSDSSATELESDSLLDTDSRSVANTTNEQPTETLSHTRSRLHEDEEAGSPRKRQQKYGMAALTRKEQSQ